MLKVKSETVFIALNNTSDVEQFINILMVNGYWVRVSHITMNDKLIIEIKEEN